MSKIKAGAAVVDISPKDSQFLFGYPHVERYSEGIHDPLLSSAFYISDGTTEICFVSNDIIFVSKDIVARAREGIKERAGIEPGNILISATHTHSGPLTMNYASNKNDPAVPKADQKYIELFTNAIIEAAVEAKNNAVEAKLGLSCADGTGVGTNRRYPQGPSDPEVPVLIARDVMNEAIACMLVYSMHPTVLHEDSKLVSADFPGMTRSYLQNEVFGRQVPIIYHTGPEGNQSPRHVTKANSFDEAKRLGSMLGMAVAKVLQDIEYFEDLDLSVKREFCDLPKKEFPKLKEAKKRLDAAVSKLEELRSGQARSQEVRTAECDWFGAEETVALAEAAEEGSLAEYYTACLPAEVQLIRIGNWNFIAWPGEVFIEYALELKKQAKNSFIICLANGELQGYIATKEAALEGGYEASNALFHWKSGEVLLDTTLKLLRNEGE